MSDIMFNFNFLQAPEPGGLKVNDALRAEEEAYDDAEVELKSSPIRRDGAAKAVDRLLA